MKRSKKFLSILLALILFFSNICTALAMGISINPAKEVYSPGEQVELTSDFEAADDIDWHYIQDGKREDIPEKGKKINFQIPNNSTKETVSTVVYAVYNDDKKWTNIDISPSIAYQFSPKWKYDYYVHRNFEDFVIDSNRISYVASQGNKKVPKGIIALKSDGTILEGFNSDLFGRLSIADINGREFLFVVESESLYKLDTETGDILSFATFDGHTFSRPYVDDVTGNVYIAIYEDNCRTLYALNADLDECLWKVNFGAKKQRNEITTDIIKCGERLYVLNFNEMWAFDTKGRKLWEFNCENTFTRRRDDPNKIAISKEDTIYIVDTKNLYALDARTGEEKWHNRFDQMVSKYPVLSPDKDYIYITAKDESGLNLFKIDAKTGDIEGRYYPGGAYAVFGENDYLYTNTVVYDKNLTPIANYQPEIGQGRSDKFCVGKEGEIYRTIIGERSYERVGIERADICDATDKTIEDIAVLSATPINMFPGERVDITAGAINKYGASFPDIDLVWESDDETVATAVYGKDSTTCTIETHEVGKAKITIRVKGKEDIKRDIEVKVNEPPVPYKMYFKTMHGERIGSIEGYVGEELVSPWLHIEDQYGNFIKKQPVEWKIGDSEMLGALYYEGGSGDGPDGTIKYQALLSAIKSGNTTLTASLKKHPGVSCEIPVTLKPKRTWILWEVNHGYTDLDVIENKSTYHIMGKSDEIYYTTKTFVRAINKLDQSELWKYEVDDKGFYGFAAPKMDESGNIYVHEKYNKNGTVRDTCIVKLDGHSGEELTRSEKKYKTIKELEISKDYIYVLTRDDKLYQLDKNLQETAEPIEFEESLNMLLKDEQLYVSAKNKIYKITSDMEQQPIYEEEYSSLRIEGITDSGDIILQRNAIGHYDLLSISKEGIENWHYKGLESKVNVGIDEAGKVYAIEVSKNFEKMIYFLDSDGTELVKRSFADLDKEGHGVKPVIDLDGNVYVATSRTTAFSPSGDILWQSDLLGSFVTYIPNSIVVEADGTVYMGAHYKGILAMRGKIQQGLGVMIEGKDGLALDTCKDLELELTNYETKCDVIVQISLKDLAKQRLVSMTHIEISLEQNITNKYECGLKIPDEGNFDIEVNIFDKASGESLYVENIEI